MLMKNTILLLTFITILFATTSCKAKCGDHFGQRLEDRRGTPEDCKKNKENDQSGFKYGSGDHDFSIEHDGLERTYTVHVPPSYDKKTPLPVVLVLHGGYGNAKYVILQTWMSTTADQDGFIVVYPEAHIGSYNPKTKLNYQHWNGGPRTDPNKAQNVDDVGFISAMLDKLERDFSVDPQRIFATGISNGGTMTYRLACQLSDRIAAIAPVAANQLSIKCNPNRPVSILHIHGEEDVFIPFRGGVGPKLPDNWKPVDTTISEWAQRDACQKKVETKISEQVSCTTHTSCKDDSEVTLCLVKRNGHTWPGKGVYMGAAACKFNSNGFFCNRLKKSIGPRNFDVPVNNAIWEFFKKHPMK